MWAVDRRNPHRRYASHPDLHPDTYGRRYARAAAKKRGRPLPSIRTARKRTPIPEIRGNCLSSCNYPTLGDWSILHAVVRLDNNKNVLALSHDLTGPVGPRPFCAAVAPRLPSLTVLGMAVVFFVLAGGGHAVRRGPVDRAVVAQNNGCRTRFSTRWSRNSALIGFVKFLVRAQARITWAAAAISWFE